MPTKRRKRPLHHHLKHAFIPHKGNGYHPHVLRKHHLIGHAAVFTAFKVGIVLFATLIPSRAFLAPNVLAEQGRRIIELTNALRKDKGLAQLVPDTLLGVSSQDRADDMAEKEYFSHVSPTGKRLGWFLSQAGYPYREAGENLAAGFSDADSAMVGWEKSPTHYANLVDGAFEQIGVGVRAGVYQDKPTVFLVQHFGTRVEAREPVAPVVEPKNEHPEPVPAAEGPKVAAAKPSVTVASAPAKKPSTPKEVVTLVAKVEKPAAALAVAPVPTQPAAQEPAAPSVAEPAAPEPVEAAVDEPVVSAGVTYDADRSFVSWKEEDGHVNAEATVYASGDIKRAEIVVRGQSFPLFQDVEGKWIGQMALPESADQVFRVIIPPTVRFISSTDAVTQATVVWRSPKVILETPLQRYAQAKSWLSGSMPIFDIARWAFLIGGGFFALALLVSMIVKHTQSRKEHPHVMFQTAALIAMFLLYAKW